MLEKCLNASDIISDVDVLNDSTVANVMKSVSNYNAARMLVTDSYGKIIYDTYENTCDGYALFPEIIDALNGNDVFTWRYHAGSIHSKAAAPIYFNDVICGCVYITDADLEQGALIQGLQRNILSITVILEIAVIVFSAMFVIGFSGRMRRIRSSMRIIRSGDYTHRVEVGGRDELTLLGNEFNALTEKLHTAEQQRRQFVSDASHELKTPLASIKLLSDSILQNEMDPETVKEFVEDIGNEAERLNRMSGKLLTISRAESEAEITMEIISVIPTIERVSRMLSASAKAQNVTIVHNFLNSGTILIQEDDLYQIVFNLVENGIKYNSNGGSLTISVFLENDNVILSFKDKGSGIPEDSLPKIFERFYRVDKARSRKTGGSGLGLSIVKEMVERNAGSISVASTLNEGTEFILIFPQFDTEENL